MVNAPESIENLIDILESDCFLSWELLSLVSLFSSIVWADRSILLKSLESWLSYTVFPVFADYFFYGKVFTFIFKFATLEYTLELLLVMLCYWQIFNVLSENLFSFVINCCEKLIQQQEQKNRTFLQIDCNVIMYV